MEKGLAIITGADGGMGQVITAALAKEGYPVIMACLDPEKAVPVCTRIQQETGNTQIEVREINLASLSSVNNFTGQLLKEGRPVSLLMNNAGILTTPVRKTEDGLETIVSVNYVAPYMLTRQLLPLMQPGCRIVNTVSCTYAIGRIEPDFFEKGRNRSFFRIPVYSNPKLALLLFTQEFCRTAARQRHHHKCLGPGNRQYEHDHDASLVRPAYRYLVSPLYQNTGQGAATAIHLALSDEAKDRNGCCYANCKKRNVSERIRHHAQQKQLWDDTEILLRQKGIRF